MQSVPSTKILQHPYHIVNKSPWPFFISMALLLTTVGGVLFMHRYLTGDNILFWGLFYVILFIFFWFKDIILESTFEGNHTTYVQNGLRLGMKLFILSEVMFFFSFFWAFFHSALVPHIFIGNVWPPKGIIPYFLLPEFNNWMLENTFFIQIQSCIDATTNGFRWAATYIPLFTPYTIPLAATFILLSSGATLHIAGLWFKFTNTNIETKSTKMLLESYLLLPINLSVNFYGVDSKNYSKTWTFEHLTNQLITTFWITIWLVITISLGIIFTYIQSFEYIYLLPFNINDSVFGSCFYLLTGFHGLHVIIGTIGLIICLIRHLQNHFTQNIHIGFECASWYWHFVDAVWLFVFIGIYWWSAPLKIPYLWNTHHTIGPQSFVCNENTLVH